MKKRQFRDLTDMDSLDLGKLHDDSTLTAEEVASWLRVKVSWVREHASGRRRPHLPSDKLGKYIVFRWGTLKEWRKELRRR